MTVRDLLRACNYTFPNLLVVVNGAIIPHEAYDTSPLHDGDDVKVLHFFGGG
jgi:sulfur carrier protein